MPPKRKAAVTTKKKGPALPKTLPELEQVMNGFLGMIVPPSGDINEVITVSTEVLRRFVKLPSSVPALVSRLAMENSPEGPRQLACVLLTKNIKQFWGGLHKTHMLGPSQSDAQAARQAILGVLHSGSAPTSVVHSLSYLTSIIARMDLPKNRFQDLPNWISGALQSDNHLHVDAALRLVYNILNSPVAASKLRPHYGTYTQAAIHWINNPPNKVIRHRALLSLHAVLTMTDDEETQTNIMNQAMPSLILALNQAAPIHDNESLTAVSVIVAGFIETPGFDVHAFNLIQTFRQVIQTSELDLAVRDSFALFMVDFLESFPTLVTKPQTAPDGTKISLLSLYVNIVSDLMCEECDDCWSVEETAFPHRIGVRILEKLFEHVPTFQLYHQLTPVVIRCFQSTDPQIYKGAYFIVMMLSQYAPGQLTEQKDVPVSETEKISIYQLFNQLLFKTLANVNNEPMLLFDGACITLSNIADNLSVWFYNTDSYKEPLEAILTALSQATFERRFRLVNAMSELCDAAKDKTVPYIQPVMDQIAQQLNIDDVEQQQAAIRATTNIALSTGVAFTPYFAQILPLFESILARQPDEKIQGLQYATYVCLSACARAIGVEQWTPELNAKLLTYTNNCIQAVIRHDQTDWELIDHYTVFLGNIGMSLAEIPNPPDSLLVVLTAIYDACIAVIVSLNGINFYNTDYDAPKMASALDDDDGEDDHDDPVEELPDDDDDNDEEDDDDDEQFYFDDGAISAKIAAITSIGFLVETMGERIYSLKLSPLKNTTALFIPEDENDTNPNPVLPPDGQIPQFSLNPIVRIHEAVIQQLTYLGEQSSHQQYQLLSTLLTDSLAPLVAHLPLTTTPGVRHQLPERFLDSSKPIVGAILAALGSEDEAVCAEAFSQLDNLINTFGISILSTPELTKELYDQLLAAVNEELVCIAANAEFKDEGASAGEFPLECAATLIGTLALRLGPVFLTEFLNTDILEGIKVLCGDGRPANFRATWIGCLAEVLERAGPTAAQVVPQFLPLIENLLRSDDGNLNHNAMFFLSECLISLRSNPQLAQQLPPEKVQELFQMVVKFFVTPQDYFDNPEIDENFHDNVVAASLNFILTYPSLIPTSLIPQILTIFPLHGDSEEIVKMLLTTLPQLFTLATEVMRPFAAQTLAQIAIAFHFKYFAGVYIPRQGEVVQFAKQLISSFPQESQNAPQHLSRYPEAIAVLQSLAQ